MGIYSGGERTRIGIARLLIEAPDLLLLDEPTNNLDTEGRTAIGALIRDWQGSVRRSQGPVVLLDQHVAILDRDASVLANFRRLNPGLDDQAAHAACARFSFRNRDALQSVGTLSGGERLRAGLACTLAGEHPPWLLMLDEPTNHLDIESVEVLEQALHAFDGALLVVSHDTAFLKAIGIERTLNLAS